MIQDERKVTLQVYGAFAAGIAANLYPIGPIGILAFILGLGVLIAAYILKGKAEEKGLLENHMIYIIRTYWIGSLYLVIGLIAAGVYMGPRINLNAIQPVIEGRFMPVSAEDVQHLINAFMSDNETTFLIGLILGFGLAGIFFVYRCTNGVFRASKGYRVSNLRSWF